jgi:transcriptional regulator of heat shock response
MHQRALEILDAVVQGFINEGEPISSGWLYARHDFGIKPAMIRLELEQLSEDGFLEQPYHSAGRIPSDRAYEFFAERVLEQNDQTAGESVFLNSLRSLFEKRAWPTVVRQMSDELHLLSIANDARRGISYKEGLDDLIESMPRATQEEIASVVKDFVELDGRLAKISGGLSNMTEPRVFVGKKSPVTKSECLAVVMGNCGDNKVFLLAIGPKNKMDYKKTIKVFRGLKHKKL